MTQSQASIPDPMDIWRKWLADSERQWNAFLNQAMATDEFSKSMGRYMDAYLNMQKGLNEAMGRYLTALNLPSRDDIAELGDRIGAIEDRLARIETALAAAAPQSAPAAPKAAPRPKPARTKKPQKA